MKELTIQSDIEYESASSQPHALRDMLIVAAPIVGLGLVGNLVGLDTLTGGAIINLDYVLAILLGGFILKRQGSGWDKIGLGKPAMSWRVIANANKFICRLPTSGLERING